MGAEIVVVTWNLQGRDPVQLRLLDAMRTWNADVLLLQEAAGDRVRAVLPPDYASCFWWPHAGERPGIAIVSRLAADGSGVMEAAPASGRPRLCWARLRTVDGALTVASVHLAAPPWPGTPGRRARQRAAVASWARGLAAAGERLVVGGDFNTADPSLAGLADASVPSPSATWRPLAVPWMRPFVRIDAIFAGGDLRPVSGTVDDRWRRSDHCPVVARLAL